MTVIVASAYLPYTVTFDLDKSNPETLQVSRPFSLEKSDGTANNQHSHGKNDFSPLGIASNHVQTISTAPSHHNPVLGSADSTTSSQLSNQAKDQTKVLPEALAELPDIFQTIKESNESNDPHSSHLDSEQKFFLGKNAFDKEPSDLASSAPSDDNPLTFATNTGTDNKSAIGRRYRNGTNDKDHDVIDIDPNIHQSISPELSAFECSNDDIKNINSTLPKPMARNQSGSSSISSFAFSSLPTSYNSSAPSSPTPDQSIVPPRKPVEPQQLTMRVGLSSSPKSGAASTRNNLLSCPSSSSSSDPYKQGNSADIATIGNKGSPTSSDSSQNSPDSNNNHFPAHFPDFYKELSYNDNGSKFDENTIAHSVALDRLSNLYATRNGKGYFDLAPHHNKVQFQVEKQKLGNGGLRNAIKRALVHKDVDDVLWVGYSGIPSDDLSEKTQSAIESTLRSKYHSIPVFTKEQTFDGCYNHYCKEILWPTMHYQIPDHPKSKAYEDHSWEHYSAFNQAIADKVIKAYKPGDVVWVNDYHLLLVPQMVREKLPDAEIGFFLHIAFPSSEVFRVLAARKKLLEGVLASNCIGFQIDEYRRHFLQTCNRILTVDFSPAGVRMNNRFISVVVNPIGIDTTNLDLFTKAKDVRKWQKDIRDRYTNVTLFIGRDKLDRVKGVKEKLLAYELFLKTHPEMVGKVALIQVCQTNKADPELASDVSFVVDRINSMQKDFGSPAPCVFLHQDIDFAVYIALLCEASSFVITSLREGMNLTCHEFVYCNDRYGPLILSEFTGAASELGNGAILVNPFDRREMAEAFYQAATMSDEEKRLRWSIMNEQVVTNTCENWVGKFLGQLKSAWNEDQRRHASKVPNLNIDQLRKDYQSISNANLANSLGSLENTPESTPVQTPLGTPKNLSRCGSRSGSFLNLYQQSHTQTAPQNLKKLPKLKKRIFFLDLDTNTAASIPHPLPPANVSAANSSGNSAGSGLLSRPLVSRVSSSAEFFNDYGIPADNARANLNLARSDDLSKPLELKKDALLPTSQLNLASLNTQRPSSSRSRTDNFGLFPLSAGSISSASTGRHPLSNISTNASTTTISGLAAANPSLRINQVKTSEFLSPQRKISMLYELVSDSRNIVYVVSNDTRRNLERMLKRVGNIGIIAENGAYIRPHSSNRKVDTEGKKKDSVSNNFQNFDVTDEDGNGIGFKEDEGDGWFGLIDWNKTQEWKGMIKDLLQDACEGLSSAVIEEEKTRILLDVSKCLDDFEDGSSNTGTGPLTASSNLSANSPTNVAPKALPLGKNAGQGAKQPAATGSSGSGGLDEDEAADREEAREKMYALIGGIVSHVNDSFQDTYNVHARFNPETKVVEISSEATSKLGGIKRAFEQELRKCAKHNQEAAISAASRTLSSLSSTSSSGPNSSLTSAVSTPKPSRRGSFSNNGAAIASTPSSSPPLHDDIISMVFIAGEAGDSESDMIFEWGNSIRHINVNAAASGTALSSAVSNNPAIGGAMSSFSSPNLVGIANSPYSMNNPLLAGSEFTGLSALNSFSPLSPTPSYTRLNNARGNVNTNSELGSGEESSYVAATSKPSSQLAMHSTSSEGPVAGFDISTPLSTLQKNQQDDGIKGWDKPSTTVSSRGGSSNKLSEMGSELHSSLGNNDNGGPVMSVFASSNRLTPVSSISGSAAARRSEAVLQTPTENPQENSGNSLETNISGEEEAVNNGSSGGSLSAALASLNLQQPPLSGLSEVLSRNNSSSRLNKEISTALSTGSGHGSGNVSIRSSAVSLPALASGGSPIAVTSSTGANSMGVTNVNLDVPDRFASSALSDNPLVYTVSIGGTGTYAESSVDGVNGLIQALVSMLGQTSNHEEMVKERDVKMRRNERRVKKVEKDEDGLVLKV